MAGRRFAALDRELRNRVALDSYAILHLVMIAGVVLVALGLKKTLLHVDEPLEAVAAVALCGGAALYLIGHVLFRLRNLGTVNRQRLFAAVILLALIPFATAADALAAVLAVAAVHVALIAYETMHFRDSRQRVRKDGAESLTNPIASG